MAIKLGYTSISSQVELIESYESEMKGNKLSIVVLQNLVIDYMYMFDTDHKTRSRICTKLGISMKEQRKINQTSKVKRT
jgi:hypothetical protein